MGMADAPQEKPRRRWFCLTPDRCVVLMLAVEGLLWLSEHFRWFPFNEYKGYSVLICMATVGAALLLMFLWFAAALVFRWRFQFSILSLLVLVIVVAIPFSWPATEMKAATKQRAAVDRIEKAGGTVSYDYQFDPAGDKIPSATPPGAPWLHKLLGDDLFVDVTQVSLLGPGIGDAELEHIKGLPQLQLILIEGTDAGVRDIQQALPRAKIERWKLRVVK